MKALSGALGIIASVFFLGLPVASAQQLQPVLKVKPKTVQRASDLHVEIVSFRAAKQGTTWYWYATIKNSSTRRSIPRGRMQIKTEQIAQAPAQTFSAGKLDFNNNLGPRKTHGFTLRWNRQKRVKQLRFTALDKKTGQILATRTIGLASDNPVAAAVAAATPGAVAQGRPETDVRRELTVEETRYLGRGKWEAVVKNTGTVPLAKGDYSYTWEYDISGIRTDPEYLEPHPGVVPAIGYGRKATLEGNLLGQDCITLQGINLEFIRTEDGAAFTHKIRVQPPVVTIDTVEFSQEGQLGNGRIVVTLSKEEALAFNLKLRARIGVISGQKVIQTFQFEAPVTIDPGSISQRVLLLRDLGKYFRPETAQIPPSQYYLKMDISVIMGGNASCVVEGVLDRKHWSYNHGYGTNLDPVPVPDRYGW